MIFGPLRFFGFRTFFFKRGYSVLFFFELEVPDIRTGLERKMTQWIGLIEQNGSIDGGDCGGQQEKSFSDTRLWLWLKYNRYDSSRENCNLWRMAFALRFWLMFFPPIRIPSGFGTKIKSSILNCFNSINKLRDQKHVVKTTSNSKNCHEMIYSPFVSSFICILNITK